MNENKTPISEHMKAFIIEEAKLNPVLEKTKDFKNIMDVIIKELSKGKSVTTVIQGKLVSLSYQNGQVKIIDR